MNGTKIICSGINGKDVYSDYLGKFEFNGIGKVYLRIAYDSVSQVKINGNDILLGLCSDFICSKTYTKIDITKFCISGTNIFFATLWYYGENTQTYIKDTPYILFDIISLKKTLLKSDKNILSRLSFNYRSGYSKVITSQLGFSFLYDFTLTQTTYLPSVEIEKINLSMKHIKNMRLLSRQKYSITGEGTHFLIDMKRETVGYVDFDVTSYSEQTITVSYGEHLVDGRVPRIIGARDFSFESVVCCGNNKFLNLLRRIAGRYLEINCKNPIRVNYVGIRPAKYPLIKKKKVFIEPLIKKIYDVSVYTLECCMHEHYEDCPWREQALYTMDSRNQMLCGYYAFKGFLYQKENIRLIAKSQREDGLLSICAPSGIDLPIPFFSLVYPFQVAEYIEYSKDAKILKEVGSVVYKIFAAMENNTFNGLIKRFGEGYWNFYEWTNGSDGNSLGLTNDNYELILNCAYLYFKRKYDEVVGVTTDFSDRIIAIRKMFYNIGKTEVYLSENNNKVSVLGCSFAILSGILSEKESCALAEKLTSDNNWIDVTLSMRTFFYDALLSVDRKKYARFVIEDIIKNYSFMLEKKATTFWETIKGESDFDGAGSLCHGWSAIPVYYFNLLMKELNEGV